MSSPGHDELRRWREQGRAPAGSCPFCASRISVVERDGVFVARCSHRGCGARGPKHHDLTRACDLFAARRRGRLAAWVASMPEARSKSHAGRCSRPSPMYATKRRCRALTATSFATCRKRPYCATAGQRGYAGRRLDACVTGRSGTAKWCARTMSQRSNSDHLSSENAALSSQVESMAMRIESLAEELAKPEDVRLREVLDALDGRAVIFDGLGRALVTCSTRWTSGSRGPARPRGDSRRRKKSC